MVTLTIFTFPIICGGRDEIVPKIISKIKLFHFPLEEDDDDILCAAHDSALGL